MTEDEYFKSQHFPASNCVRSLVPKFVDQCHCRNCRKERGLPQDELKAVRTATKANEKFDNVIQNFIRSLDYNGSS